VITLEVVADGRHAVLDLLARRVLDGDHIAGGWRHGGGATGQADIGEVSNTKGASADGAVRVAGVVDLDGGLRMCALVDR
jgi:hypothetical protein